MPFLGSKYAKIVSAAGALPRIACGSLQCSPRPQVDLRGRLATGKGDKGRDMRQGYKRGEGRGGREEDWRREGSDGKI